MNFNLVEMYNGLLRFNKHILNELAEGFKQSDFNIDGTFTRVHPFIISHTKTMTRTREDGKEEVFSACIKPDDTRYLGGNKSSSVVATKLQGRPRTGISYDKAAVALILVLRLALVTLILVGFGRILMLVSASLPQLSLIK